MKYMRLRAHKMHQTRQVILHKRQRIRDARTGEVEEEEEIGVCNETRC